MYIGSGRQRARVKHGDEEGRLTAARGPIVFCDEQGRNIMQEGDRGEDRHLHWVSKDVYGVGAVQQSEGSLAGRHMSILRSNEPCNVADGHGIHHNPEEVTRWSALMGQAGSHGEVLKARLALLNSEVV